MVCGRDLMRLILLFMPALAYGINCAHPENSAETAVCSHADLKTKDQDIERQTASLKTRLSGENAAILADTEMPFLRQRNDCSNESDIPACLATVLSKRLDLLTRAQQDAAAIHDALGQAYYIDIGFLWKYWPQLVGRKLSVFGCLSLDDGPAKTHATLETDNQKPVAVVFKSMTEEIADFLDDQKPCSHWLVTVRKESDKPVLFGDEVLGRPLP
jgi:uncharacterized protein